MIKSNKKHIKNKQNQNVQKPQLNYKYQTFTINDQQNAAQNFKLNKNYNTLSQINPNVNNLSNNKSWTDNKIEEIKRKYHMLESAGGNYNYNSNGHKRNFTYSESFVNRQKSIDKSQVRQSKIKQEDQKSLSKVSEKSAYGSRKQRAPLREKSYNNNLLEKEYYSNVNSIMNRNDHLNNKNPSLNITKLFDSKKSYHKSIVNQDSKPKVQKKKFYLDQPSFMLDQNNQTNKSYASNITKSRISAKDTHQISQSRAQSNSKDKILLNRYQTVQPKSHYSLDKYKTVPTNFLSSNIEFLNTNYNPRINNIDFINNRIKRVLEDFNNKDDIKLMTQNHQTIERKIHHMKVNSNLQRPSQRFTQKDKSICNPCVSRNVHTTISPTPRNLNLISPKNIHLASSKNNFFNNNKFQARRKWIEQKEIQEKSQLGNNNKPNDNVFEQKYQSLNKRHEYVTTKLNQIENKGQTIGKYNHKNSNNQLQRLKFTFNKAQEINKIKSFSSYNSLKNDKPTINQQILETEQNQVSFNNSKPQFKKIPIEQQTKSILLHESYRSKTLTPQKVQPKSSLIKKNNIPEDKINQLKNIKSKYQNRVTYRSTITDYQIQSRINQSNASKIQKITAKYSPIKARYDLAKNGKQNKQNYEYRTSKTKSAPKFDLTNIKENKSESIEEDKQDMNDGRDQIRQFSCEDSGSFDSLIKLTKSGIENRKKIKDADVQKDGSNNKNFQFLQLLIATQIQLDQKLRKAKFWFKYSKQQSKTQKLAQALNKKQTKQPQNKLIQQLHSQNFQMLEQQIDPFYSVRLVTYTYDQLINIYLQSQKNWTQTILKPQIFQKLIQNKWLECIDMQKKGFINLSDITRFMNFNSDSFYRNRDLVLVFKRLVLETKRLQKTGLKHNQKAENIWLDSKVICLQTAKLTARDLQNISRSLQC